MTDAQRDEIIRRLGHAECAGLTCGDRDDDLLDKYLQYGIGLDALRDIDLWLAQLSDAADFAMTALEEDSIKELHKNLTEQINKVYEIEEKLRKELLQ